MNLVSAVVSGFKGVLSLSNAVNCLYCFFIIISFVSYYLPLVWIHTVYLELVQNLHVIHTCILFSATGIWNCTIFFVRNLHVIHIYICILFSTTGMWNCTIIFVCCQWTRCALPLMSWGWSWHVAAQMAPSPSSPPQVCRQLWCVAHLLNPLGQKHSFYILPLNMYNI